MDLTTGWDISKQHMRREAWLRIQRDCHVTCLVIGSPPCAVFRPFRR